MIIPIRLCESLKRNIGEPAADNENSIFGDGNIAFDGEIHSIYLLLFFRTEKFLNIEKTYRRNLETAITSITYNALRNLYTEQ